MPEIDRELREHQGLSGGAPDARFRAIFERTPIGVAQVCLSTGLILDVNDKLCRIVGCSREGLIGRLMADFVKPEDWVIEQGLLKRMIAGEIDSYELEKRYLRADGTIAWARVTAVKMCDAAGRPLRLSIVEDITARKKAETALQEREERLHAIVETAVDAIITITERGRIDFVNSAATTLFGYTKDEMLGQNVSLLMPQPDRAKHDGYLDHYVQTGRASIIGSGRDVIALHKDGHTFPVHLAVNEVHLPQQRLFTAILHDLSGRRRLEKLVAEASAREQQRIGQDLHDGLGQQLAGLSFFCKSLITRLDAKHSPEAADARRMNELITSALQQARGMARGLNPVSAGGLETALAELAHYISTTFAIPCRFEHDGDIEIEDTTIATHAYRIAQEAVTNAVKHAKPWNVTISLVERNDSLELTIRDDGTGMPDATSTGGNGREIMRARAAYLNGTLEIRSCDGSGTAIVCRFPKPPEKGLK